MKRLALVLALAGLTGGYAAIAGAQATPPALPPLNATQQDEVQRQLDPYRTEIDGRVARGELNAEEAGRLLRWREWQIAQQVAGLAPPPGPIVEQAPAPVTRYVAPPVYYAPAYPGPYYAPYYYAPYYYAPYPYYWGVGVCAGGWGRHFGGRFCI
jgi:hypothetical protein